MSGNGRVARSKTAAPKAADGTQVQDGRRVGLYGEQYVRNLDVTKHVLADEGSYFVLTNPTPGSALASAVNASSDFTKSLFIFYNSAAAGGPRCYLDYVKILPTTAPASATSMQFAVQIDTTNRYTSGGTGPTAGVNVNGADGSASVGKWYYSSGSAVITTAAASNAVRLVARGVARSVVPAVLEEIVLQCASDSASGSSSGTTAGRTATNLPPIVLDGGQSAVFNVWFPSNAITGLSYEFEVGWYER